MHKRLLLISLLLSLLVIGVGTASAQGTKPISASLEAPGGRLTVGDPIRLTLAVTHPAGYQVIPPAIAPNWGDFTVVAQGTPATVANGDGAATTTIAVDARLFKPGAFSTPPLDVTVTDGKGNLQTATAAPAEVAIASVLASGDTELRDIKPQATLPVEALWPWIVVGAALLGAIAFVVLRTTRRARPVVDNRLPHEKALDDLAAIEALRLPEQGRFKEHYTLVSATVRTYVERRFAIPALERTTGEIQTDLARIDASQEVKALFVAFLHESDVIKFSKFTPDLASAAGLLARGRAIVAATLPAVPAGSATHAAPSKPGRASRRSRQQPLPHTEVSA